MIVKLQLTTENHDLNSTISLIKINTLDYKRYAPLIAYALVKRSSK